MDDKIKDILGRIRDAASTVGGVAYSAGREAGKFAGNTLEIAKLNMKIFDLKTENEALLKKLGLMIYGAHRGAETDETVVDAILQELDSKQSEISELRTRAAELKKTMLCPDCGEICGKDDAYCKKCGHRF